MFKLPAKPSSGAHVHELADFAELLAWANQSVSTREIVALLGREGDNEPNVGCEDVDDENTNSLEEVMSEVERRQVACRSGYPFSLDVAGNVLRFDSDGSVQALLYGYLLLSTRLNMATCRKHAGIDGADLLEEVSAQVLQSYLGKPRAKSIVFGTAAGSANFSAKVASLCGSLGEARGFQSLDSGPVHANDDKLDVVGWLPFQDQTPSQIVVFGQCKTGTAWSDRLCQLQPTAFIKKWINGHFLLEPIRAFFVSEAVNRARWGAYAAEGGLLFDRCRLVDCCELLEVGLVKRITKWNRAALQASKVDL